MVRCVLTILSPDITASKWGYLGLGYTVCVGLTQAATGLPAVRARSSPVCGQVNSMNTQYPLTGEATQEQPIAIRG